MTPVKDLGQSVLEIIRQFETATLLQTGRHLRKYHFFIWMALESIWYDMVLQPVFEKMLNIHEDSIG